MDEQVRRGHEVVYFFSGRQYPLIRRPRLRRWRQRGVLMLEVVNSPLYDHGRQPDLEVSEPSIERLLDQTMESWRPDVVHVQELAGLPSSVLEVVRHAGLPVVVTLQDYFPLCPSFKLLDHEGRLCLRHEIGADCVATTAAEPRDPRVLFKATRYHDFRQLPVVGSAPANALSPVKARLARWVRPRNGPAREAGSYGETRPRPSPDAYQRRREVNVERLSRADRLIAMSKRVAEIYELLGVDARRTEVLQLTLRHVERLRPRRASGVSPVTFATLGGLESTPKGGEVVLDALDAVAQATSSPLRFLGFGWVDPVFEERARRTPGLELRGRFSPEQLDALLEEVDVGVMPSIWEEAYGYAGVEFLAKGIPVIGNAIGGIPEYVREGETGWLNRSCSAGELARIMIDIVERPEQVVDLNSRLHSSRDAIVEPLASHAAEMERIYREVIDA